MDDKQHKKKREWESWRSPKDQQFQMCDPIHDAISVFYPINLIIDTPEFQRLRRIAQLGVAFMVYPAANHDRFTHSLGVYHLALRMLRQLSMIKPELQITSCDQLCVCIAALIHDLGHGPFSHMYESKFLRAFGDTVFEHETMSWTIFEYMLSNNNGQLKAKLDEYLDSADYQFIKELIKPPKDFLQNSEWTLKGRPREKSFLYEIVSNPTSGLDVDKIDYLLRDSSFARIGIPLNSSCWNRILNEMDVTEQKNGLRRISHPIKIDLHSVFESRKALHEKVYRHKTCVAVEHMYVEALLLADPHIKILGSDGQRYRMSTAYQDAHAFVRLNDHVISRINDSDDPNLADSQAIIRAIESRELPKYVGKLLLDSCANKDYSALEREIESDLKSKLANYPEDIDILAKVQSFDFGLGVHRSPLKLLIQFENKDPNNVLEEPLEHFYDSSQPLPGGSLCAYCYVPYKNAGMKQIAKEALQALKMDKPKYLHKVEKRGISPLRDDCPGSTPKKRPRKS